MSRLLSLTSGDRTTEVRVDADDGVIVDDRRFCVEPLGRGLYRVSHEARQWVVAVAGPREDRWVSIGGQILQVDVASARETSTRRPASGGDLTAPMPATVIRVSVSPGTPVRAGDVLIVLEAMKMELSIRAPRDGLVGAVHCKPGELVQPGVPLLEIS